MSVNPIPDPYGVDVAFDTTGDIVVGPSGDLSPSIGPYNVAQAVALRIKTAVGELALWPQYGSSIPRLFVGSKANAATIAARIQAELAKVVQSDPRVVSASLVEYSSPAGGQPDSSQYGVEIQVIGGFRVTLADVANPTLQDVTAGIPVDPASDPLYMVDTLTEQEFFAGDEEFDTLSNIDATASLAADLPTTPGN
jgi:phage baseplate assembly protein W